MATGEAVRDRPRAGAPQVPTTFAAFRNLHAGETMLVCGLGASLNLLAEPERFLTIGVNDIGRRFDPDYLLVLNSRPQFSTERFAHIAGSRAAALFSHLKLDVPHPNVVQVVLGSFGAPDFSRPERLAHTRNSPYVAVCLAVYMGARRIGLIGVDFTDNHFFGPTGRHPLSAQVARMDEEYRALARACTAIGVELVNISPHSRITSLPRMDPDVFAGAAKSARALRIVSYATTPVAGVPHVLTRCIAARTPHRAETVWPRAGYGNGVEFGGGIETRTAPAAARQALEAADAVILHNGFVAPADRALMETKPTLTLAHNYKWNVDDRFVRRGAPGLVVAQYQAALPEFSGWIPVPQPMPLWEDAFRPELKGGTITIAYTPSGKHERYPHDHRLYWHGKGYDTTLAVLDRLARRHGVQIETIRGAQVSHAQSLAMKRRAHIVIDECVTGSYHRNSLEGLAAGSVVVNGLGLVPEITRVVRQSLGLDGDDPIPFEHASLETLEPVLERLIALGPQALAARGLEGRSWLERHWSFPRHWCDLWLPAIDRAMGEMPRARPKMRPSAPASPEPPQRPAAPLPAAPVRIPAAPRRGEGEVSVVIAHGEGASPAMLDTCLGGLRDVAGIAGVTVVELARESGVAEIAARHGAEHIFCRTGQPFAPGRARDIATPFARSAYILWLDTDCLLPARFVLDGLAELRARGLDSLSPGFRLHDLSEADSAAVIAGRVRPGDCVPVRVTDTARNGGGPELVRRDFLMAQGGIPAAGLDRDGADHAWRIKARLLGTQAASRNPAQVAYRLFRPASPTADRAGTAQDADTLAVLRSLGAMRGRAAFLRHFPPPAFHPAPWEGSRQVACPPGAAAAGAVLARLFGPAVELVPPDTPHHCALPDTAPDAEAAAMEIARRLAGLSLVSGSALPAAQPGAAPRDQSAPLGPMALARKADFDLPEFAAAGRLGALPRARAWELPFALRFGNLPPGGRVVDRSVDPVALDRLIATLHPAATCQHLPAGLDPDSQRALAVPDASADLVTCLNTLECLPPAARAGLVADMARMLRPGGRLVVTCDYHFAAVLRRPDLARRFGQLHQVTPQDIARLSEGAGLVPLAVPPPVPEEGDRGLFRNIEPCPHALMGLVFRKPGGTAPPPPAIALALLPGADAPARLADLRREAMTLLRLGYACTLLRADPGAADLYPFERVVNPSRHGPLNLRAACMAAAGNATSLFTAEPGSAVPPLLVHALAVRLTQVSGAVAGLVCYDRADRNDDAAGQPVLGVRLGPPRSGGGPLALWRLPAPAGGIVLPAAIAP